MERKNTQANGEKTIDEIIAQMTIDDKLCVLAQVNGRYGEVPRLEMEGVLPQDVPAGSDDNWICNAPRRNDAGEIADGKYHPVAFPANSALAMSFDRALVRHVASRFGEEARANPTAVDILNRPAMNLKRAPRCGRNYDYFSEDPVLTGELAAAYIRGLQDDAGVASCPKHFLANTQEYDRMNTNEIIDERTLHEVYLRAWQIALAAKPEMIMSAYNRINGSWVNSSREIMRLLREELKYDGIVVSDFLAVQDDKIAAHKNTMDIELANPALHKRDMKKGLEIGDFSDAMLEKNVRRVIAFAQKRKRSPKSAFPDMQSLHKDSVSVAQQCIALLKNENALPLAKSKKILAVGYLAENPVIAGSGSGFMNGYDTPSPLEALRAQGYAVDFARGYSASTARPPVDVAVEPPLLREAAQKAQDADIVIAFVGSTLGMESESYDRADIQLPTAQREMLDAIAATGKDFVIVLAAGSVYDIAEWVPSAKAIIYSAFAGEGYAEALAAVIAGEAEPGGRLAETFPMCEEHTPAYFNFTPSGFSAQSVTFGEGILTGYRWYATRRLPVLFPFGFGLSYTTFEFSDFRIDRAEMSADEKAVVSIRIKNSGNRAGSQVVQLYVRENGGRYLRPERELKDFQKVFLAAGEEATISFTLTRASFELYSDTLHHWGVQSDSYSIILATSAAEEIAHTDIFVHSADEMRRFTRMTPLVEILKMQDFHSWLSAHKPEWMAHFFSLQETDFLVLMLPLPFHRLSEPIQGEPFFSIEEIDEIIALLNKSA